MKKMYLVLMIVILTIAVGFFACNSAKNPSDNNEGITIISCQPPVNNKAISLISLPSINNPLTPR